MSTKRIGAVDRLGVQFVSGQVVARAQPHSTCIEVGKHLFQIAMSKLDRRLASSRRSRGYAAGITNQALKIRANQRRNRRVQLRRANPRPAVRLFVNGYRDVPHPNSLTGSRYHSQRTLYTVSNTAPVLPAPPAIPKTEVQQQHNQQFNIQQISQKAFDRLSPEQIVMMSI